MNQIFIKFYGQKLFTLKQANKIIKNYQVCKNNLKRLQTKNLIKRIRNSIYYIVPLDNQEFYPNKIHIASELRKEATICCNTALNAYNMWPSENTIYILSKYPAKIRIKEITYKMLNEKDNFGIEKQDYQTGYSKIEIKITDLERTIIDCIRTRSIKFEDMIFLLKTKKPEINMKKVIKYLEKYKKPLLYNKIGLLFDILNIELKISREDLEDIKKKLSKKIFYLKEKGLRLLKPKYKYYQRWNLMIPENIFLMLIPKPVQPITQQVQ